jgi:hypothetical protein
MPKVSKVEKPRTEDKGKRKKDKGKRGNSLLTQREIWPIS